MAIDESFIRAMLVGIMLAIAAGPVGSFILWKRLAYFGDALAHSALLGVVFSILFSVDIIVGVFIICVIISIFLSASQLQKKVSSDALLGILSHSSLAFGLIGLAVVGKDDVDLEALLFGNINGLTIDDVIVTGLVVLAILVAFIWQWRSLVSLTISPEVALAEKISNRHSEFIFLLISSALVAVAMKIVGALLIGALLIIPASAARIFARSPEQMAVLAAAFGGISVFIGLTGANYTNLPSGPTIVISCLLTYLVCILGSNLRRRAISKPVDMS